MYADKFHSKSVPPKFLQVEAYTARAERFGEDNKRRWLDLVAKYGVPDIPALAEKYGMRVIDQGLLREIFVLVTVMGELFVVESFLHVQSASQVP